MPWIQGAAADAARGGELQNSGEQQEYDIVFLFVKPKGQEIVTEGQKLAREELAAITRFGGGSRGPGEFASPIQCGYESVITG
jgi:hypothetical protein